MKTVILFFYILLLTTTTYCQSQWQENKTHDGIKFSSREVTCDGINFRFLKIENTLATQAKVSYQVEIQYQDHCVGCDNSAEYRSSITLPAGGSVFGSCEYTIPARLDVLVSNPNLPDLRFKSYAIKNITVELLDQN